MNQSSNANVGNAQVELAPELQARQALLLIARGLLGDFLSTIVFAILWSQTHNLLLSTVLAIVIGLAQIAWQMSRGRRIEAMQWGPLLLVALFGTVSLLTNNPLYLMVKPTLIYAAIATIMLKPGWMIRYMPPVARTHAPDVITNFGYIWAALLYATAAGNLVLALYARPDVWVAFLLAFPLASKIGLVTVQYVTTRLIVRKRLLGHHALTISWRSRPAARKRSTTSAAPRAGTTSADRPTQPGQTSARFKVPLCPSWHRTLPGLQSPTRADLCWAPRLL